MANEHDCGCDREKTCDDPHRDEPWERIDGAHQNGTAARFWGVFGSESYSPFPSAVFATEQMAIDWIKWQESRGDDQDGPCDPVVCPIEKLNGWTWNSHEEPPAVPS